MKNNYLIAMLIIVSLPILYTVYLKSTEDKYYPSVSSIVTDQNGNHMIFFSLMLLLSFLGINYEKQRNNRISFYSIYFLSACVLMLCFFGPNLQCHISYAALAFFSIVLFMISTVKKSRILSLLLMLELVISGYLFYIYPKVFNGQIAFLTLFVTYFVYLHFLEN